VLKEFESRACQQGIMSIIQTYSVLRNCALNEQKSAHTNERARYLQRFAQSRHRNSELFSVLGDRPSSYWIAFVFEQLS